MTARALRDTIAAATGLTKKQVDDYFTVISEVLCEALASGEKVELLKFGNLRIRNYQKWQENISLPDIAFTGSKAFDDLFNISSTESTETREGKNQSRDEDDIEEM